MKTTGYHCSPSSDLTPHANLCVADDRDIASAYRRGCDGVAHYLYTFSWNDSGVAVADEATLIAAWERVTGREHDESAISTWDVAKNRSVRAALLADGYDAIAYGDSHEGCNYETTDFLRLPASLKVEAKEAVQE